MAVHRCLRVRRAGGPRHPELRRQGGPWRARAGLQFHPRHSSSAFPHRTSLLPIPQALPPTPATITQQTVHLSPLEIAASCRQLQSNAIMHTSCVRGSWLQLTDHGAANHTLELAHIWLVKTLALNGLSHVAACVLQHAPEAVGKKASERAITGTDADLRRLSMEDSKRQLMAMGMEESEVKSA